MNEVIPESTWRGLIEGEKLQTKLWRDRFHFLGTHPTYFFDNKIDFNSGSNGSSAEMQGWWLLGSGQDKPFTSLEELIDFAILN